MNQVTNLTQHKNIVNQKDWLFGDYKYESQMGLMWVGCVFETTDKGRDDTVYRLVIEEDKWYMVVWDGDHDEEELTSGSKLLNENTEFYESIRPAKYDEIPTAHVKELTTEEKIQALWPLKTVCMCEWSPEKIWAFTCEGKQFPHILAQSYKGFCTYVYEDKDGNWYTNKRPTANVVGSLAVNLPVAALFGKEFTK